MFATRPTYVLFIHSVVQVSTYSWMWRKPTNLCPAYISISISIQSLFQVLELSREGFKGYGSVVYLKICIFNRRKWVGRTSGRQADIVWLQVWYILETQWYDSAVRWLSSAASTLQNRFQICISDQKRGVDSVPAGNWIEELYLISLCMRSSDRGVYSMNRVSSP